MIKPHDGLNIEQSQDIEINQYSKLGIALMHTRKAQSKSLADIANILKIRKKYLEHIENCDWDENANDLYKRFYIRCYAKYPECGYCGVSQGFAILQRHILSYTYYTLFIPSAITIYFDYYGFRSDFSCTISMF